MSTGEVLVARAAMKPLATLNRPVLTTVDVVTKEETVSFKERTDVTAVPALGVVAETMVALVLADEALRKFGGDSVAELRRNHDAYLASLRRARRRRARRPGRPDGGGQDDGRAARRPAARPAVRRRRRGLHPPLRPHRRRGVRRRRRGRLPAAGGRAARRAARRRRRPCVAGDRGRRRRPGRQPRAGSRRRTCSSSTSTPTPPSSRPGPRQKARPLPARRRRPAGRCSSRLYAERDAWYREVADEVLEVGVVPRVGLAAEAGHGRARSPSWCGAGAGGVRTVTGRPGRAELRRRSSAPAPPARSPSVLPAGAQRAAVVTQAGHRLRRRPGRAVRGRPRSPTARTAKSMATVEDAVPAWSRWGLTRGDVVVGVGGGVVTDVAGFAAAVYHRGVAVVHVPTTLLGMVDAAIGGKTGVNLPEGKNLVGAFWQPAGVLCDLDALATLPPRELPQRPRRAGQVPLPHRRRPRRHRPRGARRRRGAHQGRRRRRRRARGRAGRAILNYGHTLAHALETGGGYDLRHGEAVAIGLVYAAELGRAPRAHRRRPGRRAPRTSSPATTCRLAPPPGADADELVDLMAPRQEGGRRPHLRPRRPGRRRGRRRRRRRASRRDSPTGGPCR